MCTRARNPSALAISPTPIPKLPVEPTATSCCANSARAGALASTVRSSPAAISPWASARRSASSSISCVAPRALTEPATGSRWSHLSQSAPQAASRPRARCKSAVRIRGEVMRPPVSASAGNTRANRAAARSKRCCAALIWAWPSSPGAGAACQSGLGHRQGSAWRSCASSISALEALGKAGGSGRDMPPFCLCAPGNRGRRAAFGHCPPGNGCRKPKKSSCMEHFNAALVEPSKVWPSPDPKIVSNTGTVSLRLNSF